MAVPTEARTYAAEVTALLDRRLIFVMGKGGTGKSTVAAALGLAAARRNRRVLVCEIAGQDRIARALAGERDDVETPETISIDPQSALEDYLRSQLPSRALLEILKRSRIFQYLVAAAPGARELLTVGKVWEMAQLERPWSRGNSSDSYDLVVVDAPATGHGLALLASPRTFREVAGVGRIQRQAGHIDAFLRDPQLTAVVAVTLGEEMPVSETLELEAQLAEQFGLELSLIVANAVQPLRFDDDDAERLAAALDRGATAAVRDAIAAALSQRARAAAEHAQLARLGDRPGRLVTLPQLFKPALGRADLDELSRRLEPCL
jgi:anion-transporting  ArsA/GET3 family ATPase